MTCCLQIHFPLVHCGPARQNGSPARAVHHNVNPVSGAGWPAITAPTTAAPSPPPSVTTAPTVGGSGRVPTPDFAASLPSRPPPPAAPPAAAAAAAAAGRGRPSSASRSICAAELHWQPATSTCRASIQWHHPFARMRKCALALTARRRKAARARDQPASGMDRARLRLLVRAQPTTTGGTTTGGRCGGRIGGESSCEVGRWRRHAGSR